MSKAEFKKNKERAKGKTDSYTEFIGAVDVNGSTKCDAFFEEWAYNLKMCDRGWKSTLKMESIVSGITVQLDDYDCAYKIQISDKVIYLELYELANLMVAMEIIKTHRPNRIAKNRIRPKKSAKHTKLEENND